MAGHKIITHVTYEEIVSAWIAKDQIALQAEDEFTVAEWAEKIGRARETTRKVLLRHVKDGMWTFRSYKRGFLYKPVARPK